jgi:uracil-DNA glycosylase
MVAFSNTWDNYLQEEFNKPYYEKLRLFLKEEYKEHTIYPEMDNIFNALKTTSYEHVKIVILGQDPYHGANQAHGMAFSVKPGVTIPPSLKNIYKEINQTLGCSIPNNGYLMKWAEQGVLLLNTVLTVRAGSPQSHKGMGWETFTDHVITTLNNREEPVIFMLWGAPAKKKIGLITQEHHFILTAAHPSPLSGYNGFFGCDHFRKANEILKAQDKKIIDWQIDTL